MSLTDVNHSNGELSIDTKIVERVLEIYSKSTHTYRKVIIITNLQKIVIKINQMCCLLVEFFENKQGYQVGPSYERYINSRVISVGNVKKSIIKQTLNNYESGITVSTSSGSIHFIVYTNNFVPLYNSIKITPILEKIVSVVNNDFGVGVCITTSHRKIVIKLLEPMYSHQHDGYCTKLIGDKEIHSNKDFIGMCVLNLEKLNKSVIEKYNELLQHNIDGVTISTNKGNIHFVVYTDSDEDCDTSVMWYY